MKLIILTLIFLFVIISYPQSLPPNTIQIHADDLKWIDAPPPMPSGVKIAILEGNPKLEGLFTIRVMLPPYFKVRAHWHPKDERVTVLSGMVYVGFGDKTDTTNAAKFQSGDYYVNPPESHHYVFTQSEGAAMQLTGIGPWFLNYIEEDNK